MHANIFMVSIFRLPVDLLKLWTMQRLFPHRLTYWEGPLKIQPKGEDFSVQPKVRRRCCSELPKDHWLLIRTEDAAIRSLSKVALPEVLAQILAFQSTLAAKNCYYLRFTRSFTLVDGWLRIHIIWCPTPSNSPSTVIYANSMKPVSIFQQITQSVLFWKVLYHVDMDVLSPCKPLML